MTILSGSFQFCLDTICSSAEIILISWSFRRHVVPLIGGYPDRQPRAGVLGHVGAVA